MVTGDGLETALKNQQTGRKQKPKTALWEKLRAILDGGRPREVTLLAGGVRAGV